VLDVDSDDDDDDANNDPNLDPNFEYDQDMEADFERQEMEVNGLRLELGWAPDFIMTVFSFFWVVSTITAN
jgi:hypothetical protein